MLRPFICGGCAWTINGDEEDESQEQSIRESSIRPIDFTYHYVRCNSEWPLLGRCAAHLSSCRALIPLGLE